MNYEYFLNKSATLARVYRVENSLSRPEYWSVNSLDWERSRAFAGLRCLENGIGEGGPYKVVHITAKAAVKEGARL